MIDGKWLRRAGAQAAVIAIVFAVFGFRAPEWIRGLDSDFIVYGQSGVLPPGTAPVTKVIAQIAVGSFDANATKYKTVIQVVNEGTTAATISGNFYNEDGTASTLVVKTNVSTLPTFTGSFTSVSLAPNGILVITADTVATFAVNWAKIVSRGGTVSTSAYFDLTNGAGTQLYSRVGVPASEVGMSRFTIPRVRNVDAGLDIGFALVNTGTTSATIDATLRSEAGAALGTKSLRLAAGAHTAAFAKDFFALTGEATGTNYSFMAFESQSAQFAATALAIEGGSLAGFPISVPGSTGSATEISDGSVTTVKLVNGAVTADKIADGAVVKSINSLKDTVTLAAGTNVTITPSGNTLIIAATGGSAAPGGGDTKDLRAAFLRMCGTGPVQGKFLSSVLPGAVQAVGGLAFPTPNDLAFDGTNIWVAFEYTDGAPGAGGVYKVRTSDGAILEGGGQAQGPVRGVAFDGADIWFTEGERNGGGGKVVRERVNGEGQRIAQNVGVDPWGLAFDGANLWVTNNGDSTVSKVRVSDLRNLGTFATGTRPRGLAFDGTNIWVANYEKLGLLKLRASDGANLGSAKVGAGPTGVVFDGANLWVTNNGDNTVSKVRASDSVTVGTFATGSGPTGVAFDGTNIWVTNSGDNTVTRLRASDGANRASFATGSGPTGVAFDGVNIWVGVRPQLRSNGTPLTGGSVIRY